MSNSYKERKKLADLAARDIYSDECSAQLFKVMSQGLDEMRRRVIQRELVEASGKSDQECLDFMAKEVVEAARGGESWAIQEIGNVIDGEP